MAIGDQQFTGHEGGPPPYRPLSGGAVTALVLALLLALFAYAGVWWLMVLPVLVVALAWPGVSSGRRRGKVLLWITLALSVGLGGISYLNQRHAAEELDRALTPLMTAIDKDDRVTLEKWALESVPKPAAFDLWRSRLENARKEVGTWSGSLRIDPGWVGVSMGLFLLPGNVVEVEPVGPAPIDHFKAAWLRAPHAREDLWIAVEIGESGKETEGLKDFARWLDARTRGVGGPKDAVVAGPRFLRDVRVFRVPR